MNTSMNTSINTTTTDTKSMSSRSRGGGSAVLARAREYNRIIEDNNKNNKRSKSYDRNNIQNNKNLNNSSYSHHSNLDNDGRDGISGSNINVRSLSEPRSVNGSSVRGTNTNANTNVNSQLQQRRSNDSTYRSSPTPSQKSASRQTTHNLKPTALSHHNPMTNKENNYRDKETTNHSHSQPHSKPKQNQHTNEPQSQPTKEHNHQQQVVTPELLVDALSGHEDGLLAIAERLMEHYDSGYDAMGEAIIDAFADVQKLFQHVVEAAHMEGAAYEAGRRDEEIERLKRALGAGGIVSGDSNGVGGVGNGITDYGMNHDDKHQNNHNTNSANNNAANSSPLRHEEFVDQDVRDVLLEAIRKGQGLKDTNKFSECYHLYEQACNSASALLPVDSDHRGRLQLSIARAESMSAERACAILKYVMDDVLRSGLTSNSKVVMPDPSQRGDCVLTRPSPKSKIIDDASSVGGVGGGVVLQSSEEALASMVEEMKEIIGAPVYDNSPLQSVADRFWTALGEAQRTSAKAEERLEQKLGELKGDFLLAKMVSSYTLCVHGSSQEI